MESGFDAKLGHDHVGVVTAKAITKSQVISRQYFLHPPAPANPRDVPLNFQTGRYNTGAMCKVMYHDLETIGDRACGKEYLTHMPGPYLVLDNCVPISHMCPTCTQNKWPCRYRSQLFYAPYDKTAVLDCGNGIGGRNVSADLAILTICAKT